MVDRKCVEEGGLQDMEWRCVALGRSMRGRAVADKGGQGGKVHVRDTDTDVQSMRYRWRGSWMMRAPSLSVAGEIIEDGGRAVAGFPTSYR